MPVASTEIRNRALRKLGVIGWGESPDSSSSADMDLVYGEVYKRLEDMNLTTWASDADVPDLMVKEVVALCALERVSEHKASPMRYEKLVIEAGKKGERAIGRIRSNMTTPQKSTGEAENY